MKRIFLTLFLISAIILLYGCSNDDDCQGVECLPPETQSGANTAGCLVNGKVLIPKQDGISPSVVVYYQLFEGNYFFNLSFIDQSNGGLEGVRLRTGYIELEENQVYVLDKNRDEHGDFEGAGGEYQSSFSNEYHTTSVVTGEIFFTRVDPSNSTISGTFWFDAINEEGEIVEVREGRFDWDY
jgi:hypothetical protein